MFRKILSAVFGRSWPKEISDLASQRFEERSAASEDLTRPGSSGIQMLVEGLNHHNSEIRHRCLSLLGRWAERNPGAIDLAPILVALDDRDGSVRSEAARLLGQLRHRPVVPQLLEMLASETDYNAFPGILGALSYLKSAESIAPLALLIVRLRELERTHGTHHNWIPLQERAASVINQIRRELGVEDFKPLEPAVDALLADFEESAHGLEIDDIAKMLVDLQHPKSVPVLNRYLERGRFNSSAHHVRRFVEAHSHLRQSTEREACARCGKSKPVTEMKYLIHRGRELYFCAETCWDHRERVVAESL